MRNHIKTGNKLQAMHIILGEYNIIFSHVTADNNSPIWAILHVMYCQHPLPHSNNKAILTMVKLLKYSQLPNPDLLINSWNQGFIYPIHRWPGLVKLSIRQLDLSNKQIKNCMILKQIKKCMILEVRQVKKLDTSLRLWPSLLYERNPSVMSKVFSYHTTLSCI